MSTCYSKTEQIVVVPLNKNNGPFKIGDFFAHPVYQKENLIAYSNEIEKVQLEKQKGIKINFVKKLL